MPITFGNSGRSGTRGIILGFCVEDDRIAFEEKTDDGAAHAWFSASKAADIKERFGHPNLVGT